MNATFRFIVTIIISIALISVIFGMIASANIDLGVGNLFLALIIVAVVFVGSYALIETTADKIEEKITNKSTRETEEIISKKSRLNKDIYSSLQKYVNEVNINSDYKAINDKVIKTDGFYTASKSGYNSELRISYQIFFALVFNKNGFVILLEDENRINITLDEIAEFGDLKECDKIGNITKYSLNGNKISMKYFEPDDGKSYEEDIVNPNHFNELKGIVDNNSIVINYYKSYFNYALQDYSIENIIENMKFMYYPFS